MDFNSHFKVPFVVRQSNTGIIETMVNSNPASPSHFGFAGNFSADDIQELLGAMVAEHQRSPARSSLDEVDEDCTDRASVDRTSDDVEDGAKAQARSERKRSREKQRRSDVNRQFADLTGLLKQIEAEEAEEDNTVARLAFSPTNRVDMIARTITHLERLRAINKRRKLEVESLQQQLDQAKKAGEDTAAKLKEVMFNQPSQQKQVRESIKSNENCNESLLSIDLTIFVEYSRLA